ILLRGLRLEVVEVHVPRAAVKPDQNDSRVLPAAGFRHRLRTGSEDAAKSNTGHPSHAYLQKAAPAQPIAIAPGFSSINAKHHGILCGNRWKTNSLPDALAGAPGGGIDRAGIQFK